MRRSWRGYADVKDAHVDEIVLFIEGDYVVALCDDAVIVAEVCTLVLTMRDFSEVGRVHLCGFKFEELEQRVLELMADGWIVHVDGLSA